MRNELEKMEQIENYLLNKMNPAEKTAFENEMQSDATLKAAVQDQQLLISGLERLAVKGSIHSSGKNYFLKKSLFKWGLGLSGVITAAALAVFALFSRDVQKTDTPFIHPPLSGINIPYSEFIVNPETGLDTAFPSGSVMRIPKNAFLDGNGKLVDHPVMLKYREFRDPLDFFLSGIPMQYDSAGKKYEFESGGMFEINAFQDGAPLKVNPVNPICIQLVSDKAEHHFNKYFLDTLAHNWVYRGKADISQASGPSSNTAAMKDTVSSASSTEKEWKEAQKNVLSLENRKPCVPKKLDENKYNFNIAADPDDFPELAVYKGMRFEVSEENKDFTSAMYKTIWEDVIIKDNVPGVNYKIILKKEKIEHSVIAYPVFRAADYEYAMKEFKGKFSRYNKLLEERKTEENRAYKYYLAEQAKYEAQVARNSVNLTANKVLQTLAIDGFGCWNSDWPIILPKGALLWLLLADENGEQIKNPNCYLVDKGLNAVFHYSPHTMNRFEFNPLSDNVMWAIGEQGLYVFKKDDFKKVDVTSGKYTFTVKKIDTTVNSKESLKTALGI